MIESLGNLFLKSDDKMQKEINAFLKRQIFAQNWLWCTTVHVLYFEILDKKNMSQIYTDFTSGAVTEETMVGFLHMSQAFGKHIQYEDVHGRFGHVESIIVSRCLLGHVENVDVQVAEDFSRIQAIQAESKQNVLSNR